MIHPLLQAALACLALVMPAICLAQLAPAAATPGFSIGAGLLSQYDSNVTRVPTDAGAGSWINEASALVGFDQTYGRQHVFASADVGRVLYKQLSQYNYTAEDLRGGWHMNLPESADAALDVSRAVQLARFADLNSVARNVISTETARAVFDYPVATAWRPIVGGTATRVRNSNGADTAADLDTAGVDGGIRYQTGSENQVDLVASALHGSYPDAEPGAQVSPYHDKAADLRVKWRFSGSSTVFGRVGYQQRHYEFPVFPNFSGPAYDMTYVWEATARTSLTLLVLRHTGATGDNQYLSSVTRTYSLSPTYAVTSKIQVQAQFELSQFDFLTAANVPSRNDRVHSAGAHAVWTPQRWLKVSLGQTWEQRASNLSAYDYLDRITSLQLQATF